MAKSIPYWTIALILFTITAWFSEGYHHPDEHYQILEFANLHLGRTLETNMPWEWAKAMRPGLQPMITVAYIRAVEYAGLTDPYVQVFLLRLISGLLSLWLIAQWIKQLTPELGDYYGKMAWFLWCIPYLSVRYSSENWSALCFGAGALLVYSNATTRRFLWSGLCMGLAFQFRYQMAFAVGGLFLWLILVKKAEWKNILVWIAGTIPAFVIGAIADGILYQEWVFPPWNYLKINIIEDAASGFGVFPFWWYFPEFLMKMFHPIGLAILVLAYFGFQKTKNNLWVWAMAPFVLVHCLIGHKEMRFLFPALPAMLVMAAAGWQYLDQNHRTNRWYTIGRRVLIPLNLLLLPAVVFRPALEAMPYFKFIHTTCTAQSGNTVLYVEQRDPFVLVNIPITFYKPRDLNIVIVDSFSQPTNLQAGDLLFSEKMNHPLLSDTTRFETAYCYFPSWIQHFDFGGWQSRSRIWKVYRVKGN